MFQSIVNFLDPIIGSILGFMLYAFASLCFNLFSIGMLRVYLSAFIFLGLCGLILGPLCFHAPVLLSFLVAGAAGAALVIGTVCIVDMLSAAINGLICGTEGCSKLIKEFYKDYNLFSSFASIVSFQVIINTIKSLFCQPQQPSLDELIMQQHLVQQPLVQQPPPDEPEEIGIEQAQKSEFEVPLLTAYEHGQVASSIINQSTTTLSTIRTEQRPPAGYTQASIFRQNPDDSRGNHADHGNHGNGIELRFGNIPNHQS